MAINATPLAPEADPRVTRPVTVMNPPDVKAEAAKNDVEAALAEIAKIEAAQAEAEAAADAPEGDTKTGKAKAKEKPAAESESSTAAKKLKDDPTPERGEDGKFVAKGGTAEGEKERKADEAAEKEKPDAKEAKAKEEPEEKPDRNAAKFVKKAEQDRQDRAVKKRADDLAAREAAIAAKEKAAAAEDERRAALKKDPHAYLADAGLDNDEAIDTILRRKIAGGKKPDPTPEEKAAAAAEARVQAILAERDKQAEEKAKAAQAEAEQRRTQENQRRVHSQIAEVRALVDADPEKYPEIWDRDAYDLVVRAHYVLYNEGDSANGVTPGTIVPLDKVAEMLDNEMRKHSALKKARIARYLASLLPAAPEPQVRLQSPGEQVRNAAPNAISQRRAAPIATPSDERRDLSDDDLLREAAKLLTYTHEA